MKRNMKVPMSSPMKAAISVRNVVVRGVVDSSVDGALRDEVVMVWKGRMEGLDFSSDWRSLRIDILALVLSFLLVVVVVVVSLFLWSL